MLNHHAHAGPYFEANIAANIYYPQVRFRFRVRFRSRVRVRFRSRVRVRVRFRLYARFMVALGLGFYIIHTQHVICIPLPTPLHN